MQYLNTILSQINLLLLLISAVTFIYYAIFGMAFFEWLAKLLRGNDDDDDSGGGGGIMQPVLVPVRVNN